MDIGRRSILGSMLLVLGAPALRAWPAGQNPPPRPKPPEPQETEPVIPADPRTLLQLRQKDIKRDVERLVELAAELKKEVAKTDSSAVLSLQLVRKAEEIERLAKHIKTLARG